MANAAGLIGAILGRAPLVLAALGAAYTFASAIVLRRFLAKRPPAPASREAVTILKPLHGAEPRLAENLATFLRPDHAGPVQLLCGVQRADDPAIAIVETLRRNYPHARIDLVVDATRHGANGKISNLTNMLGYAAHPILILSDSDIAVAPDYLSRLLEALSAPRAGIVTCAYVGRGDTGFWSRIGAAGLSYQTLPGTIFGAATGLARPCMGSTIAIRRDTLDRIGGFAAFADDLADDYAIGTAVHRLGLDVTVPPIIVTHASGERTLGELWRHELRWGATVRDLVPAAYAGSIIGLPFPLALLGALYWPAAGALLALAALVARLLLGRSVDATTGARTAPFWMLPLRDCLTLAVFVATFFVRSVDWRGARIRMDNGGRISAAAETLS